MNNDLYIIEYKLHGEPKTFIIRTKIRSNSDAWHWASCDAGVAPYRSLGGHHLRLSRSLKPKNTGSAMLNGVRQQP